MLAVGRSPQQAHGLAIGDGEGVYLENVAAVVAGLRVVGGVQADGFAVVVHGHVNVAANGLLNAGAGAAATGKQIHHQFVVHGE